MGEFNVDKTTGGLDPTAGMPESYPASQVMMSDSVTSVEDAFAGIIAGTVSVTAESGAYGYTNVTVPYGNTDYSVALSVEYAANFTNAVLAIANKSGSTVRVGFYNNHSASLTLNVNYIIIPNRS